MNTIQSSSFSALPAQTSPDLASYKNASTAEVAEKFEAMFASILIKSMRQTIGGEGMFPGDKSDSFGALFDQYMGDHVAKAGGFGVGEALASSRQIES